MKLSNLPTCAQCGEPFYPLRRGQAACSRRCAGRLRRTSTEDRICQHCGRAFVRRSPHGQTDFCSYRCKSAALRALRVGRNCTRCGGPMRQAYYVNTTYCSATCRPPEHTCAHCGVRFSKPQCLSLAAWTARRFCSTLCKRAEAKGVRITGTCEHCGGPWRARTLVEVPQKRFCSRRCWARSGRHPARAGGRAA